jgi:hypothetical protein
MHPGGRMSTQMNPHSGGSGGGTDDDAGIEYTRPRKGDIT